MILAKIALGVVLWFAGVLLIAAVWDLFQPPRGE